MSAGSANEAKEYLPFLQRAGQIPAVVDYVFSGHRFKVTAPKENVSMVFSVSGVRAPMAPGRGEAPVPLPTAGGAAAGSGATSAPPTGGKVSAKAEVFGAEARQFALDNLMQREVLVSVDTLDRNGGALGHLWVGKGASTSLWACELLNLGFAKVIPAAADRSEHAEQLFAAEEAAKAGRKGVWWAHDPAAEAKAAAAAAVQGEAAATGTTFVGVTVCDVSSGSTFSAHAESDADKLVAVESALAAMKTAHGGQGAPLPSGLKKGSMVAALFDEGDGPIWFRARIEDSHAVATARGGNAYHVTFMDYGNAGTVNVREMRPLDNVPALISTPPMARAFRLAYVHAPPLAKSGGRRQALP
jgi:staphylococcal nuclease domain-containing protein 1